MNFRAGYVAFLGAPNSGKSSWMNYLLGQKLSIVTARPQTTRKRVVAWLTQEEAQFIFVDSPGWVEDRRGLNDFLLGELEDVVLGADALVLFVPSDSRDLGALKRLKDVAARKPHLLVQSKADLPATDEVRRFLRSEEFVSISTQKTIPDDFFKKLARLLPASPGPLFDPQGFTETPLRDLASELIREKCFEYLKQEIPYQLAVQVTDFQEKPGAPTRIFADIVVGKENHKKILIGSGGQQLRKIGEAARLELEGVLEGKVFLRTHVKCKKNWCVDENLRRGLGYG